MTSKTELFLDEIEAIAEEALWALGLDNNEAPFRSEPHPHIGEGGATTAYFQNARLVGLASRVRDDHNRTLLVLVDMRPVEYEPKKADLHLRMALSCLEELEHTAMLRKRRIVRNFNEHAERESQLSAARVSLDRAMDYLVPGNAGPNNV